MKLYLTRDKNGELYLSNNKPVKDLETGTWEYDTNIPYDSRQKPVILFQQIESIYDNSREILPVFPEVKWEDEEPTEIIIKKE